MNADQIAKLVQESNDEAIRNMERQAANAIRRINSAIDNRDAYAKKFNAEIDAARQELRELQAKQVTMLEITGEEVGVPSAATAVNPIKLNP